MFPSPSLGQDMNHSLVKLAGNADPETTVKGLAVKPMVSADQEATTKMPIHLYDEDLGIPAQDVTFGLCKFFFILILAFILER